MNEKIKEILLKRGFTNDEEINKFLFPNFENLKNPFSLTGMVEAVNILKKNIENKKKILIFGDYDVDGVTSTALLFLGLKELGCKNVYYTVANRFNEGYGIGMKTISKAIEDKISLLITVDCGTKDFESIAKGKEAGIQIIITDHHEPEFNHLPNADVILNPKVYKDESEELSGCGVVFKLLQALYKKMNINFNKEFLIPTCLSTVCDIVPLINENRIISSCGLEQLNTEIKNIGLKAIIDSLKIKKKVNINDILFYIGPCINAAGRLDSATYAIDLFLANNEEEAKELAEKIKNLNEERKMLCKTTIEQAYKMVEENIKTNIIYDPSWHQGVLGIVASRCVEFNGRPTVVLTEKDGVLTGSARSNKVIDIYAALCKCSDTLLRFGGHTMAAGVSLEKSQLENFKKQFEKAVEEDYKKKGEKVNEIKEEIELQLEDINDDLLHDLNLMQPFGIGNENPILKGVFMLSDIEELKNGYKCNAKKGEVNIPAFIKKNNFEKIEENKLYNIFYKIIITDSKHYISIIKIQK